MRQITRKFFFQVSFDFRKKVEKSQRSQREWQKFWKKRLRKKSFWIKRKNFQISFNFGKKRLKKSREISEEITEKLVKKN